MTIRRSLILSLVLGLALLLAGPVPAHAQTVTPQLSWNTTDPLAKVTTYTTTLQIGTAAVTTVVPVCAAAGTGASCTVTGLTFNAAVPTTFKVTVIDPATGQSATGTVNYAPGMPPGSLVLSLQWLVKVP